MTKNPSTGKNTNRAAAISEAFKAFIQTAWEEPASTNPEPLPVAEAAAHRRASLSAHYPATAVIIPAGTPKQRSNDTDYPFRPHTAFTYLTGWGSTAIAGSILLGTPSEGGHQWSLFTRPPAPRTSDEFYANPAIGEFWTGRRPHLDEVATWLGVEVFDVDTWADDFFSNNPVAIVREADAELTAQVDRTRVAHPESPTLDAELARDIGEMRLVKDPGEVEQLQRAIDATHRGFTDIIHALPQAIGHERGERIIEGAFQARARLEGNATGYDSIVASGSHACILHWVTNDGPVRDGDLLLVDAGVEMDSLYTADITRTIPVNGRYSDHQRMVYDAVLEASDAAFAAIKPGAVFRDLNTAALAVIARYVTDWGLLPVSLEETLTPESQLHRRYMIHGTSHHLGLDVHDCATARKEMYIDAELRPGMVFTIEPGLYFQPDDLTVPPQWRGIGIRLEDNILITEQGGINLSAAIPRTPDDIEAWMAS